MNEVHRKDFYNRNEIEPNWHDQLGAAVLFCLKIRSLEVSSS